MIVLDASVLANAIADDGPDGELARELLLTEREVALPELADVEIMAVLRRRWLSGSLSDDRFGDAVADLEQLPFRRYPMLALMRRVYELRSNVTAYDGVYVSLAEALDCALITADERLARAPGPTCEVRVLRP